MAFVFIFMAVLLAFPLAAEIYGRGRDNVIVRSAAEFQKLELVRRASTAIGEAGVQTSSAMWNTASLAIGLLLFVFAANVAWQLLTSVISTLWRLLN
jgi:hypothetical protein